MSVEKNPQKNLINEAKDDQDTIVKLIEWIENNQKQILRRRDAFYHMGGLLVLLVIVVLGIPVSLFFISANIPEKIIVLLSVVAILVAFLSMVTQISERNVLEARMKHALRISSFNETEQPLLKALLRMKSKNPEQKLSVLYFMDKQCGGDVFTERGLLKTLLN